MGEGLKFARGDIDLIADLTVPDTIRYQSDPRWQPFGAYGSAASNMQGEALNTEIPPFDNVELRRAVASAIDRDHLVLLRASNLAPQLKPVPPLPGYDPGPIGQRHDVTAALEHMRKAGYAYDPATGRGGWPAPIAYDAYRGLPEVTGQSIQQDLAKIGLRLDLRISNFGTWQVITHRRGGRSPMSPQGWHADFFDPSNYLEPFTTKSIGDQDGLNYAFYSNPKVDALLERARRLPDGPERVRVYGDAERVLCDDAPWAFEYSFRFYVVRQPYVRGFRVHAMWTNDVLPLWLDRSLDRTSRAEAPLSRELLGSLIRSRR